MYDSYKQKEAAVNEQLTSVQGLSGLLRAVAGRIENNIDGLNTQLLLQSADQLDRLEVVANAAEAIVKSVPRAKSKRKDVKVSETVLIDLACALQDAGHQVRMANLV